MWQEIPRGNKERKAKPLMRHQRKVDKLTSEVADVDVAVDELASFVPDTAASNLI